MRNNIIKVKMISQMKFLTISHALLGSLLSGIRPATSWHFEVFWLYQHNSWMTVRRTRSWGPKAPCIPAFQTQWRLEVFKINGVLLRRHGKGRVGRRFLPSKTGLSMWVAYNPEYVEIAMSVSTIIFSGSSLDFNARWPRF